MPMEATVTNARDYPGADRSRFVGHKFAGATFTRLEKIVLHSTETSPKWGCPGYSEGRVAPTLTIDPWNRKRWQHFDLTESARALVNPSTTTVSENKDNVCQIEIIGYSDQKTAATYGYSLDDLPQSGLDFIAETIAFIAHEWLVPIVRPALWPLYPASYGNSPARMTSSEYDKFTGVLGHLHASGNTHGDPRLPQIDTILAKARAINTTLAPQEEDDMFTDADRAALNGLIANEAGRYVSAGNRYSDLANRMSGVHAELTATKAALGVLANSQGLDPGLIASTISTAVTDALSNLTITSAPKES